jgi:hypothetical protein
VSSLPLLLPLEVGAPISGFALAGVVAKTTPWTLFAGILLTLAVLMVYAVLVFLFFAALYAGIGRTP